MTIEQVRKFHRTTPFRPFRIDLADGRSIVVARADALAINERRKSIAVASQGVFEFVALAIVTKMESLGGEPS